VLHFLSSSTFPLFLDDKGENGLDVADLHSFQASAMAVDSSGVYVLLAG
jgi:hypothetical protein